MPYRPFLVYNIAGAFTWGIGTVLIGYRAGDAAINAFESSTRYVIAAAALAVAAYALWLWATREARAARAAARLATLESHPAA